MGLLSIFKDQIKLLVDKGQSNLSYYLDSLKFSKIRPSPEISALQIEYSLKSISSPIQFLKSI